MKKLVLQIMPPDFKSYMANKLNQIIIRQAIKKLLFQFLKVL